MPMGAESASFISCISMLRGFSDDEHSGSSLLGHYSIVALLIDQIAVSIIDVMLL